MNVSLYMNSYRAVAMVTILTLCISLLPVMSPVFAASTGLTLSDSTLTTDVDVQVNFSASAVTEGGTTTPGTFVSVSDSGAGGNFYTGTLAGACNSTTPDPDNEFSIDQNKAICYSNAATGTFAVSVQLLDGAGGTAIGSAETLDVTVEAAVEPEPEVEPVATIVTHKIVCEDPADMPTPEEVRPIDENTATDWVTDHASCDFAADFSFEWAPEGTSNPGDDLVGAAGAPWVTFGPTNSTGVASTTLTAEDIDGDSFVWFREVQEAGFELFSFQAQQGNDPSLSSQSYCHTDGINFDNYDRIDDIAVDEVFYCAAWNLVEQPRLDITVPNVDNEVLSGEYTFEAFYLDADDDFDSMPWAIRAGAGQCSGETLFGNVDGATDDFDYDGQDFSTTVDLDTLDNGEYCLVLNPAEDGGEDFRAVRTFEIDNEVAQCMVAVVSDETNTVVEKDGAFALELTFQPGSWAQNLINSLWIWGDDPVADLSQDVSQTFEKTFVWSGPVTEAMLNVSADNFFIATINGELVHTDIAGNTFREENQVMVDVSDQIDQGENTISIIVTNNFDERFDSHLQNPAGLLYRLEVTGTDPDCALAPEEPLEPATLEIIDPETDGETLSGEYTFEAEYFDNDEEEDPIKWAIRFETCGPDDEFTEAGNVGGFSDPSTFVDGVFTATVDMSEWENGEYCFVVNPQEGSGEEDLRAVRPFVLENAEPLACVPGVNLLANASFEEPEIEGGFDLVEPIGWLVEKVAGGTSLMELQRGVNGWLSFDGEQHTELGVEKAVEISQEIETIPGAEYRLSWYFSPRPGKTQIENQMNVLVDEEVVATNDGTTAGNQTEWQRDSYLFTGSGEAMDIAFLDDGPDNGVGPFLDHVSLVCDPAPEAGPYCGDGQVNQDWEQCELGDEGCTNHCTFANQCSSLKLAKITLDQTESASFDNMIYLGDDKNLIPAGVWFNVEEAGDDDVDNVADEVEGLAVERDQENGSLKLAFRGGNPGRQFDNVFGNIMLLGLKAGAVTNNIKFTDYKLENGGVGADTIEEVSDTQVDFEMVADTGNDGFELEVYSNGKFIDCPDCRAAVEARIVLGEGGETGNTGDGNLSQQVVLGDGSVVNFGEWFEVFDGDDFTEDDKMVESFADPETLSGMFVSRSGDGTIKVALYGGHEDTSSEEFITARLELRDATFEAGSVSELQGDYVFEDHNDAVPNQAGRDSAGIVEGNGAVDFSLFVNTSNDGFKVKIDPYSIDSCENDDSDPDPLYLISGFKWQESDGFGGFDGELESKLSGWEITATNGSTSVSTTTDENGDYAFWLPAGLWTVSEEDREGWVQTFPETASGTCEILLENEWEMTDGLQGQINGLQQQVKQLSQSCNFGNELIVDDGGGDGGESGTTTPTTTIQAFSSSGGGGGIRRIREADPVQQVLGASTSVAGAQCSLYLTNYLKEGMENDVFEVIKLQLFLNQQGFATPITGSFDGATTASVKLFQVAHSIEVLQPWFDIGFAQDLNPTGFVYKTTRWKVNDIVCPGIEKYPDLP